MCLCRDVIYWFCLVGSLCSEWHKSGLHYTITGPLMQRACEHDGFSEDQQSFEGKQRSVSLNAPCPSWFFYKVPQIHWQMNYAIQGNYYILFYKVLSNLGDSLFSLSEPFPSRKSRWWFYWQKPKRSQRKMEEGPMSSPAQHMNKHDRIFWSFLHYCTVVQHCIITAGGTVVSHAEVHNHLLHLSRQTNIKATEVFAAH